MGVTRHENVRIVHPFPVKIRLGLHQHGAAHAHSQAQSRAISPHPVSELRFRQSISLTLGNSLQRLLSFLQTF